MYTSGYIVVIILSFHKDFMETITQKLDTLLNALRNKGITKIDHLLPGLARNEIAQKTIHLPFVLPEEIYELYQWRNGCKRDISSTECPFLFRDHKLLSLDEALAEYDELVECYTYESYENDIRDYGVDFKFCFPFAGFEGSLYTIACGRQYVTERSQHPIIEIFEGEGLLFYTFSSMLDTCIEWVQHPSYTEYGTPLNETEVWEKHNPGIFDRY